MLRKKVIRNREKGEGRAGIPPSGGKRKSAAVATFRDCFNLLGDLCNPGEKIRH